MSQRDDLIAKYAVDLKEKCGVDANMDLLTKVTIGCGPSIYNADAATIAGLYVVNETCSTISASNYSINILY